MSLELSLEDLEISPPPSSASQTENPSSTLLETTPPAEQSLPLRPTLERLPVDRRPPQEVSCAVCRQSLWLAIGLDEVKCYCAKTFAFVWTTSEPNEILLCDGQIISEQAAQAKLKKAEEKRLKAEADAKEKSRVTAERARQKAAKEAERLAAKAAKEAEKAAKAA